MSDKFVPAMTSDTQFRLMLLQAIETLRSNLFSYFKDGTYSRAEFEKLGQDLASARDEISAKSTK